MKVPFFDLHRQYEALAAEVEPAVLGCMRGCAYIGGAGIADFEKKAAAWLEVKHAVACGNGTDAITLALRACGVQAGDEVITSPFTFFATAEAIAVLGAVPVFTDIRREDMNLDPGKIEAAVTPKTKVILPVHIFGAPADMAPILQVAKKHGLRVVEDAAQAIGSAYKGKKIGGIGDVTTFSFYPTKNLGAFGDGGMMTTNDDDLALILRALREHGAGKNGAAARRMLYGEEDDTRMSGEADGYYDPHKYFNYLVAYNSRLDTMQAAVLSVKLDHLDEYNQKRTAIAGYYTQNIKNALLPAVDKAGQSCWHQYAIRTPKKFGLLEAAGGWGVGLGSFYPVPLHLQKAFASLGYRPGSLPVAEEACAQSVCLPIYPELTQEECAYVVTRLNEYLR